MDHLKIIADYIDLEETVERFGHPQQTRSKVVAKCIDCGATRQTVVNALKLSIRKHGTSRCKSCRSKKLWENGDLKKKISKSVKKSWSNEKLLKSHSERIKKQWKRSDYRKFQENQWANKTFKERWSESCQKWLKEGKDSKLETTTQKLLTSIGIQWVRHHVVGYYEFDLFLPETNQLIECQGEYWHSNEKAKQRDLKKFNHINNYFPDYSIVYLHERDFLNPEVIKEKLRKNSKSKQKEQFNFSFHEIVIKELNTKEKIPNSYYSEAEIFLQSFHYGQFGRSAKIIYGAFLKENLIAVCKFSSVVRKEVATSLSLKTKEVLELDRFCIHPQYQKKNFASWFLSRCSAKEKKKYKKLVSFADTTYGHSGTIYKASSWQLIGETKPSYHYLQENGHIIHKKTLWDHAKKMGMTEVQYADQYGYKLIRSKKKLKFVY